MPRLKLQREIHISKEPWTTVLHFVGFGFFCLSSSVPGSTRFILLFLVTHSWERNEVSDSSWGSYSLLTSLPACSPLDSKCQVPDSFQVNQITPRNYQMPYKLFAMEFRNRKRSFFKKEKSTAGSQVFLLESLLYCQHSYDCNWVSDMLSKSLLSCQYPYDCNWVSDMLLEFLLSCQHPYDFN